MTELPASPSFRLDGRRALVTGAGRGLGLAAAAALADAGAEVVLVARSHEELGEAADAIRQRGGKASPLVLDVLDDRAVGEAISALPPLDILVNNAGTNRPMPFTEVRPEDFDVVISLNLRAAFFVAQATASAMIAAGRPGSIIHMSSQMGHVGGPRRSLYCASKWGVEGLSKAMALDLAPHAIRVNTIAPTFIETTMTAPFFANEDFKRQTLEKIKLGRLGRPEDITGAILYLASDASALVTGTSLVVDGGWTAD